MKILVVDNNIESLDMIMIMLKSKKYHITSASNGRNALEKLRSEKYDLIISDVLMPVMDGFQLCRECKKDAELYKISFIFYTASCIDDKDEEFAMKLGAQKFIRKPQEPEVLLSLIKEVMEKPVDEKSAPKVYTELDDSEILKYYSEQLVTKLEKRIFQLKNEIASYKITESHLKESEENYKTLFTVAHEAIFIADIESGILLDCNEAACALAERPKEELIGKHQSFLHPPDELVGEYTESFQNHFTGKPERVLSAQVLTKSGTLKDVEIKANIFNIRGKKIIQGFFIDVTKHKRVEEALSKEQYLLSSLIDTIPDNIYFKDINSRFIRINNMMSKRFGLNDPHKALGKTDFDFFDEEHARPAFEDEQRIIAKGESIIGLEEKEVWPDGHITWVSTTKMPLRDKSGKIIGIMGLSRDITDKRQAEEALRDSEEKYRSIVEITTEWIWEIDLSGHHTFSNQGVTAILGYRPEEIVGKNFFSLLHEKDRLVIETKLPQLIAVKSGWRGWILRWRHKDGSYRYLESNAEPNIDIHGMILGYRGSDRDITDRKQAEILFREKNLEIEVQNKQLQQLNEELMQTNEELQLAKEKAEESDRLKTAFLHTISHEIRTPLNGIIGFTDMIANPNLSPEKREQFSQIIRANSYQLLSIVNDIISIATIEAGYDQPHEEESDINELLALIKSQNYLHTETKNLSFTISSALTNDEAVVLVDKTKLLQILTNLVSNALKFTLEGYIKVNCRLNGNFIKFTVEDTGIGIPPEMHERIFNRFFQIDQSDTRLFSGTGLGLSIVKSYVHFLKGEISLDSRPGKGSVFTISIPYKPVKKLKPVNMPVHDGHKQIGPATILIAEDEPSNLELLNEFLADLNLTVINATNGLQAVEACKKNPSISLVLMDVKMPGMDGYEAARKIKKFRPKLPIIIQTAYVFQAKREESISAYIDGLIEKPINLNELLEILQKELK